MSYKLKWFVTIEEDTNPSLYFASGEGSTPSLALNGLHEMLVQRAADEEKHRQRSSVKQGLVEFAADWVRKQQLT
jgi:hypothetical protein